MLEPLNIHTHLGLTIVILQVPTVEERARWYKVLRYLTTQDKNQRRMTVDTKKVARLNPHCEYDPKELQTL